MTKTVTPEHDKRPVINGKINEQIEAAYHYVQSVRWTSDCSQELIWHGWALREAFLAGISYAENINSHDATDT